VGALAEQFALPNASILDARIVKPGPCSGTVSVHRSTPTAEGHRPVSHRLHLIAPSGGGARN